MVIEERLIKALFAAVGVRSQEPGRFRAASSVEWQQEELPSPAG